MTERQRRQSSSTQVPAAIGLAAVVLRWMSCCPFQSRLIEYCSANDRCPASWTGTGDRCCQPAETPGIQQTRDNRGDTGTTLWFRRKCHHFTRDDRGHKGITRGFHMKCHQQQFSPERHEPRTITTGSLKTLLSYNIFRNAVPFLAQATSN